MHRVLPGSAIEMSRREFLTVSGVLAVSPWSPLPRGRFVGITVLPEYIQSEGLEEVLERLLERAGATAVTTSPYVMEETGPQEGQREPPVDAGAGSVRLLDRPLWGKRELWVRTAPSFRPDHTLSPWALAWRMNWPIRNPSCRVSSSASGDWYRRPAYSAGVPAGTGRHSFGLPCPVRRAC